MLGEVIDIDFGAWNQAIFITVHQGKHIVKCGAFVLFIEEIWFFACESHWRLFWGWGLVGSSFFIKVLSDCFLTFVSAGWSTAGWRSSIWLSTMFPRLLNLFVFHSFVLVLFQPLEKLFAVDNWFANFINFWFLATLLLNLLSYYALFSFSEIVVIVKEEVSFSFGWLDSAFLKYFGFESALLHLFFLFLMQILFDFEHLLFLALWILFLFIVIFT